jgi:hypothetical protein
MTSEIDTAPASISATAEPGRFTLPQFGIFAQGTHAHHLLEFDLSSRPRRGPRPHISRVETVRDRLSDFSRPLTGAYYFAPSQNALNELPGPD